MMIFAPFSDGSLRMRLSRLFAVHAGHLHIEQDNIEGHSSSHRIAQNFQSLGATRYRFDLGSQILPPCV